MGADTNSYKEIRLGFNYLDSFRLISACKEVSCGGAQGSILFIVISGLDKDTSMLISYGCRNKIP